MLAERAGRLLKRSVLELGGFNPMIILDAALGLTLLTAGYVLDRRQMHDTA